MSVQRWLTHAVIDEFSRIEQIKGQRPQCTDSGQAPPPGGRHGAGRLRDEERLRRALGPVSRLGTLDPGKSLPVSLASKAIDKVVNPPRVSDPERLREAVSGATVLVTGASFGIGEATACKLAAAGATVLLAARSADKLDSLAQTISANGGDAVSYPADLCDEATVTALAKRIIDEHGPPDIVVSNAGKSIRRSLHHQYERPHDFHRTIGINYLGPILLLLGLLPAMRDRGSGHIVNVSSVGVRVPPGPRWGAYQASKGAFDMWLRSVAPELHTDGVDVTSIYMALIHTRMTAPTESLRNVPGLYPDQAADIVAKAIIERPRTIAPWWLWPAEVTTVLLRGPVELAAQLWYRSTKDSEGKADE
jgi:NAD(P)-dependent dehydrogenase (short-subunit alcohol dehydrogenase family)